MKRVVVIGAGNVAWSLAPAIDALEGYSVTHIASRSATRSAELASSLGQATSGTLDSAHLPDADIYIMSVSDDAVASLAASIAPRPEALWLHTSGSVDARTLAPLSSNYGVLYPLQTFTRGRKLDFDNIPLFIEASTDEALACTRRLAEALSQSVTEADSERRTRMHIAAVFGCNFTNHMLAIAGRLLHNEGIPLSTIAPLVAETLDKAFATSPLAGQTGPARRGDSRVIDAHTSRLEHDDAALYRTISDSIIKTYSK